MTRQPAPKRVETVQERREREVEEALRARPSYAGPRTPEDVYYDGDDLTSDPYEAPTSYASELFDDPDELARAEW